MTGDQGDQGAQGAPGEGDAGGSVGRPAGPQAITVVVADDHPMWRDAVARDLTDAGFTVVATAEDGPGAVRRTLATRPAVLVLDLNLPGLRGDQVCAAVLDAGLPTRVLVLSASAEQKDVLEAVKAGATGYLLKSASRETFLDAVRDIAGGRAVFTPGLAGLVLGEFRRMQNAGSGASAAPQLTERETEVLKLVATGMSYKDIAAQLYISHRTVQNHVQNTLGKLQMHNRVELVRYAISKGLHRD
jgi:DNA-binding NarL/FixJ family response regulator